VTFDITEIKTAAEIAENVATALAILLGGAWAFWKFVIQRESRAKIEFELELNILGPQLDKLIVEIIAKVTNKGLVRHWLTDFGFDLLYLPKDTPVEFGDIRINHQVLFQPLLKERYWIPPTWSATFIDPGVCQRYNYVSAITNDASYVLIHARFKYPDARSAFHTAQKVFSITKMVQANHALQTDR
jgi:hypothetical protein